MDDGLPARLDFDWGTAPSPTVIKLQRDAPEAQTVTYRWARRQRAARLKQLGNAVVPQCAEVIGRMIRAVIDGEPWGSVFSNAGQSSMFEAA